MKTKMKINSNEDKYTKLEKTRLMILLGGKPALHKMGNIGRQEDDLITIHSEDDEHYIGNFVEGFGFIDVKYKKEDCRGLTKEEVDELNGKWFGINGRPMTQMHIDYDGYRVIKG